MAKKTEAIYDQLYAYQTKLQGVANDLAVKLAAVISESDPKVLKYLLTELPKKESGIKDEMKRLRKIMEGVEEIRKKSYSAAKDLTVSTSAEVAKAGTDETAKEFNKALGEAAQKEREKRFCKTLTDSQLKAIIDGQGIDGATVAEWFHNWQRSDLERISNAVQTASVEQLTVQDITKLIRGTKANGYTDGILGTTQVSAVRLARTIVNGVSNNARVETIKANSDVIDGVKFVGTLDGKTCPHCASFDGQIWRGDDMASARRPPIHPNCRCTLVPYVELKDDDGNIVDIDSERPAANADFDALAKDAYNSQAREKGWKRRWDDLSASTRLKYYYQAQKDYEKRTGKPAYRQVDSNVSFEDYFKSQPDSFKRDWLGAKRYEAYKTGKLTDKEIFAPDLAYTVSSSSLVKFVEPDVPEKLAELVKEYEKNGVVKEASVEGTSADEETKLFVGTAKDYQGKKVADIFIDDIIKYADTQKEPLLDTLKRVFEKAEKEDLSKLPTEQRNAVEKRKEELRQLVVRGQNMVNTGTTPEYADAVLRTTYEMSKEGLREALQFDIDGVTSAFPSTVVSTEYENVADFNKIANGVGWFLSENGEKREIGGKVFGSFTEYVASKCNRDTFNKMEEFNNWQGSYSYSCEAIRRKFLVLKSMGYDYRDFNTWQEMKDELEKTGFFVDMKEFEIAFDDLKRDKGKYFNEMMKAQVVFDSAIQLVLENTKGINGVDINTQTAVVIRTEDGDNIPTMQGVVIGENIRENGHMTGVCESHGHITASRIDGAKLTVTRVPFSRIHAVWFMEKGEIDSGNNYHSVYNSSNKNPIRAFQFWAYHQNEMDVCSHEFPVIYVGDVEDISQDKYATKMQRATYDTSKQILEEWEKKHPAETTIKMMESK